MRKLIGASLLLSALLTACGGGGSAPSAPATANASSIKLSFYGNPMVSVAGSVVHNAAASGTATTTDANTATAQDLTDALAAQGVTANVSVQVMDGTTLHNLIMGSNNGLPPTPDQFKTDPSEWLIANFALDDMVTPVDQASQRAALAQFQQDLTVFIQRARVSGKITFIVLPIPTCDAPQGLTAAEGLALAEDNATITAPAFLTGGLPSAYTTVNGQPVNTYIQGHEGADCRTPDAFLQNARTQSVATDIAERVKLSTAATTPVSGGSDTSSASGTAGAQ